MYGIQNGRQTRTFSSHLEHFPFEVFKVSLFFPSLLGIQVVASLVLSRSLTPRVLAQWCRVLAVGVIPASAAAAAVLAANCWAVHHSGSRLSFRLYLLPLRPHDTQARSLCLQAPGRGLWSPVKRCTQRFTKERNILKAVTSNSSSVFALINFYYEADKMKSRNPSFKTELSNF